MTLAPPLQASNPALSRLKRFFARLLRAAVIASLILCVVVYLGQNWLAFPGMMAQGKPWTRIQYRGDAQTIHLTTASATGPVIRVVIPKADHNSIFTAQPDIVWKSLGDWINQTTGRARSPE